MRTTASFLANRINLSMAEADIWGINRITESWHISSITPGVDVNFDNTAQILNEAAIGRVGAAYTVSGGTGTTWQEACLLRDISWAKSGLGLTATLNYTGRYFAAKSGSAKGLGRTTEPLTSATSIGSDELLLPAMIMPTLRTRSSKAFRLDTSTNHVAAPDPLVDRSTVDIGGTQLVADIDIRQMNFKLRIYIDSESVSLKEVAVDIGLAYTGKRNSAEFFGCGIGTLICDGVALTHLEGEYWEIVIDYTWDEFSFHSQEPELMPDGKPRMILSRYYDVRWTREYRPSVDFNDIWADGPMGLSQKYQAYAGRWY